MVEYYVSLLDKVCCYQRVTGGDVGAPGPGAIESYTRLKERERAHSEERLADCHISWHCGECVALTGVREMIAQELRAKGVPEQYVQLL